jgi:hypothetical protein
MDTTLLTVASRKFAKTPPPKKKEKIPRASLKKSSKRPHYTALKVLTPKNDVPSFYFITQKHYAYIIHKPISSSV